MRHGETMRYLSTTAAQRAEMLRVIGAGPGPRSTPTPRPWPRRWRDGIDDERYAPSIYFPLIVEEALMIEPTETESKETLDAFCDAMIRIAGEAASSPETLLEAPVTMPVRRLDQTLAARQPNLRWTPRGPTP